MKIWIVYTDDGEMYAFSTKEKAKGFLDQALMDYAVEVGAALYEVSDFGYIEETTVDQY